MRIRHRMLGMLAALSLLGGLLVAHDEPALARPDPSFQVVCYPTGIAPNDPIVFPGQPGRSHMHTFFGAQQVTASSDLGQLSQLPPSQCGSHFTMDRSAYWIPTLYQDGKQVYSQSGGYQLHVYYRRAGGPRGARIDQAFPRGLRMIAGNAMATSPQPGVSFKCARTRDPGVQDKLGVTFPSCAANESLVLELVFPDCWDGRHLDATDHRSHMAYSRGAHYRCPRSHPVKLPQITFEAWYTGVNGPASEFSLASGGATTMHGDVLSAWNPKAFARLVNVCLNRARIDCNAYTYDRIPKGRVTRRQVSVQSKIKPPAMLVVPASSTPTMPPMPPMTAM